MAYVCSKLVQVLDLEPCALRGRDSAVGEFFDVRLVRVRFQVGLCRDYARTLDIMHLRAHPRCDLHCYCVLSASTA